MGYTEGTGAFWELAVIIYVQHLQICFESGWYSREKAGFSLPYKVYGAESAFLILISDLYDPVGPPLGVHEICEAMKVRVSLTHVAMCTPHQSGIYMYHTKVDHDHHMHVATNGPQTTRAPNLALFQAN